MTFFFFNAFYSSVPSATVLRVKPPADVYQSTAKRHHPNTKTCSNSFEKFWAMTSTRYWGAMAMCRWSLLLTPLVVWEMRSNRQKGLLRPLQLIQGKPLSSIFCHHTETHVSPNSDQQQSSPNDIHTLLRDKLWESIKWSPKRKCHDLLSNSLN